MIIKKLDPAEHKVLTRILQETAYAEPADASYTVCLKINSVEYTVKLQPERHNDVAVLQACRIDRCGNGRHTFQLITDGSLLSAFLEILLYEGVA